MARDIPTIERQIDDRSVPLPSGSAGAQLVQQLNAFGKVVGGVVENIATEEAAMQGQKDAASGKEFELRPGVNRPTRAYNEAYRSVNAGISSRTGIDLIAENLTKQKDKRNLNSNSLAQYDAESEGIIEGVLSTVTPGTEGIVRDKLLTANSMGRRNLAESVAKFDSNNVLIEFNEGYQKLREDRTAAYQTKDQEAIEFIDQNIAEYFKDYGTLSEEINQKIPLLLEELAEDQAKAEWIGEYLEALGQGAGDAYIANMALNLTESKDPVRHAAALSEMVKLNNSVNGAQNNAQALEKQVILNDIKNPFSPNFISNETELLAHPSYQNLTDLQKQQVYGKLLDAQSAAIKKLGTQSKAWDEIKTGRANSVDKKVINEIFVDGRDRIEAATGKTMTVAEQFNLVQTMQTNVPKFDSQMVGMFESTDPALTLEAGKLYSTATLAEQEGLIKLSGKAEIVAQKMVTMYNSTSNPALESVQGVINLALKPTDAQVQELVAAADKSWKSSGKDMYKNVFGVNHDPFTSGGSFFVFEQQYKTAMAGSSTADEAARIAKNGMRTWGTDTLFADDQVGQDAPDKVLPLNADTQVNRNLTMLSFDKISKAFNEANDALPAKERSLPMKFVRDPNIPNEFSEADLVYKSFDSSEVSFGQSGRTATVNHPGKFQVEVDGVVSNLALYSSSATGASPQSGYVYGMFARDEFGDYQQIKDPSSSDGLAYVVLNEMDVVAPSLFEGEGNARLLETYNQSIKDQKIRNAKDELLEKNVNDGPLDRFGRRVIEIGTKPILRGMAELKVLKENKSDPATIEEIKKSILDRRGGDPVKKEDLFPPTGKGDKK